MKEQILRAIQEAIEETIEKEVTREMEKIQARVEKQVREQVGKIAVRLVNQVDFRSFDDRLVISVNFSNIKE